VVAGGHVVVVAGDPHGDRCEEGEVGDEE